MSHYLGIEIGGTKLQIGIGAADGKLDHLWRGSVNVAAGGEGIRKRILEVVPTLVANRNLKAIGIGFGGPVDDSTGHAITSHQVDGWDDFPLTNWAQDYLHLPTVIGNDSDLAGLAEAHYGAGKGLSPVFYMNIGSGIGGALIIHGEIYRGIGRGAAEIGHLRMNPTGDILEHLASGWALSRASDQGMSAEQIGHAAREGDPKAKQILHQACQYLAEGICHVIALLCPRRIIIGGGVSLMGELIFGPLREMVAERVFRPFADCYEIVPAALGEEVVVHGALALAAQAHQVGDSLGS